MTITHTAKVVTTSSSSSSTAALLRSGIVDERDAEGVRFAHESRDFGEKVKVGFGGVSFHFGGVGRLTQQDLVEVESEFRDERSWKVDGED